MADRAESTPEPVREAPEGCSRHQVEAMARIMGLNPDNVVRLEADHTGVLVTTYVPPVDGRGRLLERTRYRVTS